MLMKSNLYKKKKQFVTFIMQINSPKLHGIVVLTMMSYNVKICHVRTKYSNFSPLICKLMAAILDFKLMLLVILKISEMKFSFQIRIDTFFGYNNSHA